MNRFMATRKIWVLLILISIFLSACSKDLDLGSMNIDELIASFEKSNFEDLDIYNEILSRYLNDERLDEFKDLYFGYKDDLGDTYTDCLYAKYLKNIGDYEGYKNQIEVVDIENVEDIRVLEEIAEYYFENKNYEKVESAIEKGLSIKKDGEASLLLAYKYILENYDEDIELNGMKMGNFTDETSDEIAFIVTNNGDIEDRKYYIKLIDGKTGDLIKEYEDENLYEYISLRVLEDREGLDEIAYFGHYGGSGTPGQIYYYNMDEDKVEEIEKYLVGDWDLMVEDGFVILVKSDILDGDFLLEIPREDWKDYIVDGIYSEEGDILEGDSVGIGYESVYSKYDEELDKYIIYKELPIFGSYEYKDYLGKVITKYSKNNDKWELYRVEAYGRGDNELEITSKEDIKNRIGENKKTLESMELSTPEGEIGRVIEKYKGFLDMNRGEVENIYGSPDFIETYDYKGRTIEYSAYGGEFTLLYYEGKTVGYCLDLVEAGLELGLDTDDALSIWGIEDHFGPANCEVTEAISYIFTDQGFCYVRDGYRMVIANPNSEFGFLFVEKVLE